MYANVLVAGAECIDWMMEHKDVPLVGVPRVYFDKEVAEGRQNAVLGMNGTVNAMEAAALAAGAEIMLNTKCETLVVEDGVVVGIMAKDADGNEIYAKVRKALCCRGRFGMNRDLLKRYIPSCYEQALQGGPMPFHTGDTFRMGLGAGADYAGLNSFSCWEGGLE